MLASPLMCTDSAPPTSSVPSLVSFVTQFETSMSQAVVSVAPACWSACAQASENDGVPSVSCVAACCSASVLDLAELLRSDLVRRVVVLDVGVVAR